MRIIEWVALASLAASCGGGGSSSPPEVTPPTTTFVSAPDCPGVANMVAEAAPAAGDATHMRVQHIGDPGTLELAGEIANPVTWAAGDFTGFHPADPAGSQRGFRDASPPDPASVFQLACNGAGFLINTWQFSHRVPLVGEGPSVSIARELSARPRLFAQPGTALTIEARIDLRHVRYQSPHTGDGTAQLSFFYYLEDATTGTVIAHLIDLFDSRPPGVGGSAVESVGSDGQVAFVSSPLVPVDATGTPVRYVRAAGDSATMSTQAAWGSPVLFKAQVSYDAFAALLARLRAAPLPAISARPEDYRLILFGVLGEVFPGTGDEHNVALGAGVFDLKLAGTQGLILRQ